MKGGRLIAAVLVGGLFLAVASLGVSRKPVADPQGRPSTLFTDKTGARAFYLLLQQTLGADAATQLRGPLSGLQAPGSGPTTLIVAGPTRPLEHEESYQLNQWLEQGGQVILASHDGWGSSDLGGSLLESHGVTVSRQPGPARKVQIQPGDLTLSLTGESSWEGEYEVLASSAEQEIVAVTVPIGKGRIVAIGDQAVLSNQALRAGDNGLWLIALVAEWGNGKAIFDEHHLGLSQTTSLTGAIRRFLLSSWGLPFLQLLGLGLLSLALRGRRLGRPVLMGQPIHLTSPLLLVKARAGLLQAASARSLAISRICQELSHQVKTSSAHSKDLESLKGHRADIDDLLRIQERANDNKASEADLFQAAQMAYQIREEVLRGSEHSFQRPA